MTLKTIAPALLLLPAAAAAQPDHRAEEMRLRVETERPRVMVAFSGGSHLGVRAMNLTDELKEFYGAGPDSGVLIGSVSEASPAEAAGIRVGDVVTRVGEHEIEDAGDLRRAVRRMEAGDEAEIALVREGSPMSLTATLDEREGGSWFSHEGAREIYFDIDSEELRADVLESMEKIDLSGLQTRFADLRERIGGEWGDALEARLAQFEERLRELEARLRPE